MKRYAILSILCGGFALGLFGIHVAYAQEPDAGATVTVAPSGLSPSATVPAPDVATCPPGYSVAGHNGASVLCLPASSATAANPASTPRVAWDDEKAAKKTSWPLAVWLGLVMLGKGLAYGRDKFKGVPLLGTVATWLSTGKTAMVVAAIGAVGAAGYDVLIGGGSWVAALTASGAAIGGILHSTTKGAPAADPVKA